MLKYLTLIVMCFSIFLTSSSGDVVVDQKLLITNPDSVVSEHFSFLLNDGLSQSITAPILKILEDNYIRILSDMGLASMNKVTVNIWNDETHFLNDMQNDIGARYSKALGYVYSSYDIRLLYRGNSAQVALHEFCHGVSLIVNNRFGNKPRWLWEAVACYEAGDFMAPKTINYLVEGNFPTLTELNSNVNTGSFKIYQVGYTLSEYIITNWGKSGYVNLIKSNGDIQLTLGVSTQDFETGWKQFVQNKYLR